MVVQADVTVAIYAPFKFSLSVLDVTSKFEVFGFLVNTDFFPTSFHFQISYSF